LRIKSDIDDNFLLLIRHSHGIPSFRLGYLIVQVTHFFFLEFSLRQQSVSKESCLTCRHHSLARLTLPPLADAERNISWAAARRYVDWVLFVSDN
jgi:hypothetical protein